MLESQVLTIDPATLLANDTDPDDDTLTVTSAQDAVHGSRRHRRRIAPVFTPDPDFDGEASFTYSVSDGRGASSIGIVSVAVTNDPYKASRAVCVGEPYPVIFETGTTVSAPMWLCRPTDPGVTSEYNGKTVMLMQACSADGGWYEFFRETPTLLCWPART